VVGPAWGASHKHGNKRSPRSKEAARRGRAARLDRSRARGAAAAAGVALVLAWAWLALLSAPPGGAGGAGGDASDASASGALAEGKMGNTKSFGAPVVMGAESLMAKKAHGVGSCVKMARGARELN
jgi:hypothetical protein